MKRYQIFFLIEWILPTENYKENITTHINAHNPKPIALKTAVGKAMRKLEDLL